MRPGDRKVSTKGLTAQPEVQAQPVPWRQLWQRHVQSCKRRDIINELSISEFRWLSEQNCNYCLSLPLQRTYVKAAANGIDRLDPAKGYVYDNMVAACGICNRMKTGMSPKDFVAHIMKIANNPGNH
jgi:5-methylcytosine-specific restriction endonuclease McrA